MAAIKVNVDFMIIHPCYTGGGARQSEDSAPADTMTMLPAHKRALLLCGCILAAAAPLGALEDNPLAPGEAPALNSGMTEGKTGERGGALDARAASLAADVRAETLRTWEAYVTYAWPHDELLPLTKGHHDWYADSLSIAPIDAYSTLKIMGFNDEAKRIEDFVVTGFSADKDDNVKVFEVNIRILGGLLCIYELSGDRRVLEKARDFADRLLPAFKSPTGLPYYFVNLRTGVPKGNIVNVAEAGSYLFEFGILSYYTGNPVYYQTAKNADRALFSRRSPLGLLGRDINVETGEWTMTQSMVGAYADSYFEYLYKSWLLFHDPEIKGVWDASIGAIQAHIAEPRGDLLWYGKVDMNTGRKASSEVTLWDAFFPGLLALSGDLERSRKSDAAWDWVWDRNGLVPMVYDYGRDTVVNPYYQLNPEVIESAFYLWKLTGETRYFDQIAKYYGDIKKHCRTEVAYSHIKDVRTMEKANEMETFFIAETLKYSYLSFDKGNPVNPADYVFSTEAHPFRKGQFEEARIGPSLGIR
jgi:hypothetical protein